jgi:hypothetical protein
MRTNVFDVSVVVTYSKVDEDGKYRPVQTMNMYEGDGVCMGVHGWLEGDFGEDPVASQRE